MSAHDDYDDDRTDQGLWSAADREAVLARHGIGPVTPAPGGGPRRVRTRMAEQEQQRQEVAADHRPHMAAIRRKFGWAQESDEELARRERPCPTCGADRKSACTRRWGGRGPTVPAHPARYEAGIPAQR